MVPCHRMISYYGTEKILIKDMIPTQHELLAEKMRALLFAVHYVVLLLTEKMLLSAAVGSIWLCVVCETVRSKQQKHPFFGIF